MRFDLTFEYQLPTRRNRTLPPFPATQDTQLIGPPARVARLVALAHKLENMVRSGEVSDYDELARSAKVSPARIAQIVIVAQLAPAIQEYVLFLSTEHAGLITEPQLREIAREIRWDRQLIQFRQLLGDRS